MFFRMSSIRFRVEKRNETRGFRALQVFDQIYNLFQ